MNAGCTKDEIEHAILLVAPTAGFPKMMEDCSFCAAYSMKRKKINKWSCKSLFLLVRYITASSTAPPTDLALSDMLKYQYLLLCFNRFTAWQIFFLNFRLVLWQYYVK